MLVDLSNRENTGDTGAGTSDALSRPSYINRIIANKIGLKLWYAFLYFQKKYSSRPPQTNIIYYY
jgi:hypothetical protein